MPSEELQFFVGNYFQKKNPESRTETSMPFESMQKGDKAFAFRVDEPVKKVVETAEQFDGKLGDWFMLACESWFEC